MTLGKWALIDIETSGVDAGVDQIIDIGFLQFEGTKLVKEFSSLVRYESELSAFITKLTGITTEMARKAPKWGESESHLLELASHSLLAHNAEFEKSFLARYFDYYDDSKGNREKYEDSLLYLGLLFPDFGSLSLENFLQKWKIKDHEDHRGLEDSKDLLRVILLATKIYKSDRERGRTLSSLLRQSALNDWWYAKFFELDNVALLELANVIGFDLDEAYLKATRTNDDDASSVKPIQSELQFSGELIKSLFSDEERVSTFLPNYRKRDGQIQLALRVGQAFKNGIHGLVQAPTGTGKTIGYLLPSAILALIEKKPVLIATATKALQHQALTSDIPKIRKMLKPHGDTLKVTTLVGSNNHYCEALFRREMSEENLLSSSEKNFIDRYVELFFEHLFYQNGKRSTSNFLVSSNIPHLYRRLFNGFVLFEKRIGVDFRSCTGNRCPFKEQCSYQMGLKEAKEADLIIGNHALMFNWPKGLPRPSNIVIDEAHKIESTSTDAFSKESSIDNLLEMGQQLLHLTGVGPLFYLLAAFEDEKGSSTKQIETIRDEVLKSASMLKDQLVSMDEIFADYFKKRSRYTEHYWNEAPYIKAVLMKDSEGLILSRKLESIKFILENLYNFILPYWATIRDRELKKENEITAWTRFESFFVNLEEEVLLLTSLLKDSNEEDGNVRVLKYHATQGATYSVLPVNIGEMIYKGVIETSNSVLFTSATLSNATGDLGTKGIDWMTGHLFVPPEKRFKSALLIPPIFDYKNRTDISLVSDMPSLNDERFVPEIMYHLLKIIKEIKGKTLILFSSRARFEVAREILLKELKNSEIKLFVQGMGNSVVDDFKGSGGGVLLGMELFGEGVDIPGAALEFLFVDKIPDMRQDLVIEKRRTFFEQNFGNEFTDYFMAHRARSLQQKLGRLLRSENDRGAAIIVDSRIKGWKGRSMEQFNRLLAPYDLQRRTMEEATESAIKFVVGNRD